MKLDIMTKCGPMNATGVDAEAVEAFLDAYEQAEDGDVLRVPDGSDTKTTLVDRAAVWAVTADEDDDPEPEPVDPVEAGVAEGTDATEESGTQ